MGEALQLVIVTGIAVGLVTGVTALIARTVRHVMYHGHHR